MCKKILLLLLLIVTVAYSNTIIVSLPGQYVEDVVMDYDSALIGWIAAVSWGIDENNHFSDCGGRGESGDGGYVTSVSVNCYYHEINDEEIQANTIYVPYRVETQVWGGSEVTGKNDLWAGIAVVDATYQ